jgi:hypothetical protein
MASNQNSLYSTPGFELFRRGMQVQSVKRFRGMNAYELRTSLGPDWALDCLNVIVSGSGGLSKFRLPNNPSVASPFNVGPQQFWDFQQSSGTRQVLALFGTALYYYTNDLANITLLDAGPDVGPWSSIAANNIQFFANGAVMKKWTGANWWNWGHVTPVAAPVISSVAAPVNVAIATITNNNGTLTTVVNLTGPSSAFVIGQTVTVAGNSNASFNASWPVIAAAMGGTIFDISTPGISDGRTGNGGTASPFVPPAFGWIYSYAWKNSVTGHIGSQSPFTPQTVPVAGFVPQLAAVQPPDPQFDTLVWYRTLDGGGIPYRLCEVNINTGVVFTPNTGANVVASLSGGKYIVLQDNDTSDLALDQLTAGGLIENPPPPGKYIVTAQDRIFIFNLLGNPSQIAYSGYEQILNGGRPEESFPPGNRLQLSIGAESIAGGGVIHAGIIAFSQTGRFYMLRGSVNDVTTSAPTTFTSTLEELPWTLGSMGHETGQSTPYGFIWWAADKTVQLFTGASDPQDISAPVYPVLRRATPGTEQLARSAYFNWLERDWYTLSIAIDGSLAINYTIWWAFNKSNQEIDVFVSTIPVEAIGVISTSKLQRQLMIAQAGKLYNLPIGSDTVGGITDDLTIIPTTAGQLNAYWRSGYWGNDTPFRSKMYRWGRVITDQDPGAFQASIRLVDDETRTIKNPELIGPQKVGDGGKIGISRRAKRCSVEINFPAQDVASNVLELSVASIATSDR